MFFFQFQSNFVDDVTYQYNDNISREKKNTFLERCYAQSNRLSRLLRDISVLTRMDEAANMIDMERVDISVLVGNIINEVALELKDKQI
jgi:two-component system OmpR family sensor kinase